MIKFLDAFRWVRVAGNRYVIRFEYVPSRNINPDSEDTILKIRLLLLASLVCLSVPTMRAQSAEPHFTNDGQLIRPGNYREWVFLSAGLGMTYSSASETTANALHPPHFDNVFVTAQAYKWFLRTGVWPDKTMFALEVRSSVSKGSINKGGHYQANIVTVEFHVKDQSRFPGRWAFFSFDAPSVRTAKPVPVSAGCQACHAKNGAVDNTFVQFYPTLIPVAKAKGTYKLENK